jgi:hypothetical protein
LLVSPAVEPKHPQSTCRTRVAPRQARENTTVSVFIVQAEVFANSPASSYRPRRTPRYSYAWVESETNHSGEPSS